MSSTYTDGPRSSSSSRPTNSPVLVVLKQKMQSLRDDLEKYKDMYEEKCDEAERERSLKNEVKRLYSQSQKCCGCEILTAVQVRQIYYLCEYLPSLTARHWVTLSFVETKDLNLGSKPNIGLKPKLSRNIKWRLSFGFRPSLKPNLPLTPKFETKVLVCNQT